MTCSVVANIGHIFKGLINGSLDKLLPQIVEALTLKQDLFVKLLGTKGLNPLVLGQQSLITRELGPSVMAG